MGLSLKSTSSKVLASAALLAAAAGVAGMGTYGGFTASTSASTTVDAARVVLTGADAGTISVQAAKVIPGDTMERTLNLVNGSTIDLAGIALTTTASSTNLLTSDLSNGLQLQIDTCPVAWTGSGTGPYTCSAAGTPAQGTAVLAKRAVIGQNMALSGLTSTSVGKTDFLRVKMSLPTTANDDFQGLTNGVSFAFSAVTRGVTNK
ncbi:TasA family protein [Arthrobacter sp. YAF34]|uniref:TasA family protein n=1 Tax=Arthrobacter sp. YAF34 TaxID=3233083 RepID=UPI003F911F2C